MIYFSIEFKKCTWKIISKYYIEALLTSSIYSMVIHQRQQIVMVEGAGSYSVLSGLFKWKVEKS